MNSLAFSSSFETIPKSGRAINSAFASTGGTGSPSLAFEAVTEFYDMGYLFRQDRNGQAGYDDGAWTSVATFVVDNPAGTPIIEFISLRATGRIGGAGGTDAVDESGTRYFKRMRRRGAIIVLESLNSDGLSPSEPLSLDGGYGLPRLTQVLEIVGVFLSNLLSLLR